MPVLGDQAYGDDSKLRARLDDEGLDYVLSVAPATTVFKAGTRYEVPPAKPGVGRPPTIPKADREHTQVKALASSLPAESWHTVTCRDRDGRPVRSRFAFERVTAARPITDHRVPREEWLIIEQPEGKDEPTDYWLANLPVDTPHERLARLARLRWMIELDYRQLKGELGLHHYEGRSYLGFHHHCAIVTAAHGFLTLERQNPNRQRPASLRRSDYSSPSSSAGPAAAPPASARSTSPTYPFTDHHNASDQPAKVLLIRRK